MSNKVPACVAVALSLVLAVWSIAARADSPGSVWILHATDVHPLVDVISAATRPVDKARIEAQIATQQPLNLAALKDLLAQARTLVGIEGEPRLLVLSGDIDADPCWIAGIAPQDKDENRSDIIAKCLAGYDATQGKVRAAQIKGLVDALATSPIHDIYIVPGSNDVAREDASANALKSFAAFVTDIQKGLTDSKSPVRLRNLSGCYAGGADSECVADIADTSYRIVALPSYSFKNADEKALALNDKIQTEQLAKFSTLIAAAAEAHRRVIVVSHVPNIDDPYDLGQLEFSGNTRVRGDAKVDKRSVTTAWNVTKPVLDAWLSAVSSDNVAAILAGHLYDSHKEVYRSPYAWSKPDPYSGDREKLLLTPPLSVKNQDASPIQARGASLIELRPDRVRRELIWYDPATHSFTADRPIHPPKTHDGGGGWRFGPASLRHAALWIWRLGDPDVNKFSVLLIAFLAAFLTVARIWQIPPPDNPFAGAAAAALAAPASGGAPAQAPAPPAFEASPFAGNFGKTVTAGLGGLVAETVLKSLSTSTATHDKEFYVIWFVIFFSTMLVASAAVQALVEALRIRFAIRPSVTLPEPRADDWWTRLVRRVKYWIGRAWYWARSMHLPLIVFVDTFVNRLQGRNQTLTSEFQRLIVAQHNNVIRVVEIVRGHLSEVIESEIKLRRSPASPPGDPNGPPPDVRVNISVMSTDRSWVFYIATAPGSSLKKFPRRSVAWVSVFTGKIRWYRKPYRTTAAPEGGTVFSRVVLFDNTAGTIPNDESQIQLQSHYQPREEDYDAFVMFPVPWPRRSFEENRVIGAIHISFHEEGDFERIWKLGSDPVMKTPYTYANEEQMLTASPAVGRAIREAIDLLAGAFEGFNENVYWYSKKG